VAWGDALDNGAVSWPDLVMASDAGVRLFEVFRNTIGPAKPGSEAIDDSISIVTAGSFANGLPNEGNFWGAAWVDIDNDGDLDLSVARDDSLFVYQSRHANVDQCEPSDTITYKFSPMRIARSSPSTGAFAWGDYDNDGDLDLVCGVPGSPSGTCRLLRNNARVESTQSSVANYLRLDLVGTRSNRSAIGARVRVTVAGAGTSGHVIPQFREVEGGCGYSSFNSLTLEFGLGSDTQIDHVDITWPSGKVEVRQGLAVNTRAILYEPVDVAVTVSMPVVHVGAPSAVCPAGDMATMLTTVHFLDTPKRSIARNELQLGVPVPASGVKFYPEDGGCAVVGAGFLAADIPASLANGFTTTFTKKRIGGCGTAAIPVYWNGIVVSQVTISVRSPDIFPTSPGHVDAGDIAALGVTLGSSTTRTSPVYNACVDLNDDLFVDASEVAAIGPHISHACDAPVGPAQKVLRASGRDEVAGDAGVILSQNAPNPFNPNTSMSYRVARAGIVRLFVVDVRGRRVRTLDEGWREPGEYTVAWDGRDARGSQVGSGVYLCRLQTSSQEASRRMVVVR
jgi:hypothetical protein